MDRYLTVGKSEGPSKLLSTYLIRSRLSPMTFPLCSSDGTYKIINQEIFPASTNIPQIINDNKEHNFVQVYHLILRIDLFLVPSRPVLKIYRD